MHSQSGQMIIDRERESEWGVLSACVWVDQLGPRAPGVKKQEVSPTDTHTQAH